MANDLMPMKTFEAKLKERVKNDFVDLMPDEALTKMIEQCAKEVFFEKRYVVENPNGYHEKKTEIPSVFQEVVKQLIFPTAMTVAREFVRENHEVIHEQIRKALQEELVNTIFDGFKSVMHNSLFDLENRITNRLEGRG